MIVLSLFDGISCARVALERAGIVVSHYYSSEIDKYAISISEKNYNDITRLWDIRDLSTNWWWEIKIWSSRIGNIDLLIGWSPCQDLSIAKKDRKWLDWTRSGLFWEYVRILKSIKPKWFILENVASMPKEARDIISETLWVDPIMIDASLVSAQSRKRLFRTNIPWVILPIDKNILLPNIVHETKWELDWLNEYIVPFDKSLQIIDKEVQKWKVWFFRQDSQANRIYYVHGKAITLCWDAWWWAAKMWQYLFGCISPDRINKRQNGQRFSKWDKFYTLTAQDRHWIFIEWYIRKLTPIECERLQWLPDNYTQLVSNSQRYKALWNAFNVDVITHILSFLPKQDADI